MPLTATVDSTWAAVKLTIDLTGVATAFYATVTRTNADGTTHTVRSGDLVPIPGVTLAYDSEAPLGTTVAYSAQGFTYLGIAVGSPVTASGVAVPTVSAEKAWVKSPDNPTLNRAVSVAVNGPWPRKRRLERFDVIGRSNPVIHTSTLSGRAGALEVNALTAADVTAYALLFSEDRLLVQFPPAVAASVPDMWVVVEEFEPVPIGPRAGGFQRFRASVTEVDRPATTGSVLMVPGVTYESPVFANYTAVAAAKTTYNDWADG